MTGENEITLGNLFDLQEVLFEDIGWGLRFMSESFCM